MQKGTVGLFEDEENMPFNPFTGMTGDFFVNALAIPSRMTVGQLIESLLGKKCSMVKEKRDKSVFIINREKSKLIKSKMDSEGCVYYKYQQGKIKNTVLENKHNYEEKDTQGDGSAFQTDIVDNVIKDLEDYKGENNGYDTFGKEIVYNGITGIPLLAYMFSGPTYYQRLKHMVDYKIHARARGKMNSLCHQPTEGRSADGGLRVGEMERDCILGQGASSFLIDRLMDNSDKYTCHVCDVCGLIAVFNISSKEKYCSSCKTSSISTIQIPYATRLLFAELFAMGVVARILTNKKDE